MKIAALLELFSAAPSGLIVFAGLKPYHAKEAVSWMSLKIILDTGVVLRVM